MRLRTIVNSWLPLCFWPEIGICIRGTVSNPGLYAKSLSRSGCSTCAGNKYLCKNVYSHTYVNIGFHLRRLNVCPIGSSGCCCTIHYHCCHITCQRITRSASRTSNSIIIKCPRSVSIHDIRRIGFPRNCRSSNIRIACISIPLI